MAKAKETTKNEVAVLKKQLGTLEKDAAKKLMNIAEAAFSAGYEQALKDQDLLDAAFDEYMEAAANEFEDCFFKAEKGKKKAKKSSKKKK